MPDCIADHVRTIVASAAKLRPSDVRLDSRLDRLHLDWIGRVEIGFEIERKFELGFDAIDEASEQAWSTVADVITTAERLIGAKAIASTRERAA